MSAGTIGASGCCSRETSRAPSMRSPQVDAGGARILGRLAQRRARADSGRGDRRGEAAHSEGDRARSVRSAATTSSARWWKRRTAIIRRRSPRCAGSSSSIRAIALRSTSSRASCSCQRDYAESLKVLAEVGKVDPEDLQMHYTAMLAHRGAREHRSGRAGGDAVQAVQDRGVGAVDHRRSAARQAGRKQRAADDSRT